MKIRFMLLLAITILLFFHADDVCAQPKLPGSPEGMLVQAYIDAINSGTDESLRKFIVDNVSTDDLKQRPMEERLGRMKMFRSDVKSLALERVLDSGDSSITVTARTGNGDIITLTFECDPRRHKFAGLRIESGEQAPIKGSPMSKKEFTRNLSTYLSQRTADDTFSGAVLVQRGTSVLLKKAYGLADKRFAIPNRIDTKFNIGSICKFFTRVAIGQLVENGKLSLDDTIGNILPEYPNKSVAQKVTIHHLLSMTSGLGDFFGRGFAEAGKDGIATLQDYLRFFVNDSLLFEPGTQRHYSNAGYIVLGLIIEKLSGEDYYSYIRGHVFRLAGMENSDWYPLSSVTPNLATGYTHPESHKQTWSSNVHKLPERGSSAGGGYTTLDDMVSFVRALQNGKLLSAKYSQWVMSGDVPSADPALPLKVGGFTIAGGTAGVNAWVAFEAAPDEIVIVLANYDPPTAEQVGKSISGWLKGVK